jgi:hypothetical protein
MHLHESIRAIRADETIFKQRYNEYAAQYALPAMQD